MARFLELGQNSKRFVIGFSSAKYCISTAEERGLFNNYIIEMTIGRYLWVNDQITWVYRKSLS